MAVMQLEANKLGGIPYDSVVSLFADDERPLPWAGFSYSRTLTITNPSTNRYDVKVVITPTNTVIKADSLTIERAKPATSTALCTTC